MGLFDFIFGWNRKVRKLRKKWDRAREKALTKKNPLKLMILKKLDGADGHLKLLEEQDLSKQDKRKFAREIEIILAEVRVLLKQDSEDFEPSKKPKNAPKKAF